MNKMLLIKDLVFKMDISKKEAIQVVNLFFKLMAQELKKPKGRIEIRGFMSIKMRSYKSYTGRNPRTGEPVSIKEKRLPYYKCSDDLLKRINKPESR